MKYKQSIFLALLFVIATISAQTTLTKQESHTFKGYLDGKVAFDDDNRYLKNFTLGVKWSTYLGEPVESYAFKWEANNSFKVKIKETYRTFTREQIGKYPELIKRLDAVRPAKVNVLVYGSAEGDFVTVNRGDLPEYSDYYTHNGGTTKKKGKSYDKHQLLTTIAYLVKDEHLIFGRKGVETQGAIIGTSPEWNNFIKWKKQGTYVNGAKANFDGITNYEETEFKQFSDYKKKSTNKVYKNLYQNTNKLVLKAELESLDWGNQLQSIAETYLHYVKIDKKPSPKKEVAQLLKKEKVTITKKYTKGGFWGETATYENPKFEIIKEDDTDLIILNSLTKRPFDFTKIKNLTLNKLKGLKLEGNSPILYGVIKGDFIVFYALSKHNGNYDKIHYFIFNIHSNLIKHFKVDYNRNANYHPDSFNILTGDRFARLPGVDSYKYKNKRESDWYKSITKINRLSTISDSDNRLKRVIDNCKKMIDKNTFKNVEYIIDYDNNFSVDEWKRSGYQKKTNYDYYPNIINFYSINMYKYLFSIRVDYNKENVTKCQYFIK